MKKISTFLLALSFSTVTWAQGWPSKYEGVMLQGFYWDSYSDTQWNNLESQADELSEFFKIVWVPQSGNCGTQQSMGYNPLYWFSNYNSSFGTESELRSMISTFKSKGIATMADVVINHRQNKSTWNDFPSETWNGTTYQLTYNDICSDDEAAAAGYAVGTHPDTGENWDGMRDLDHYSDNLQTNVKAYLTFLKDDLGYSGYRYDMVKGYDATFTKLYNDYTDITYSVGEYLDGNENNLINWINKSGKSSALFDFATKYRLRDCCNASANWGTSLKDYGIAFKDSYKRYSITFVDNHDTYGRGNDSETTSNILAANAFILASPGTPCIFMPHWKNYKEEIKQMIYARNLARINNESDFSVLVSNSAQYAIKTTGTDGKSVVVTLGTNYIPSGDYFTISAGTTDKYKFFISKDTESAWTDVPSGTYYEAQTVAMQAISKNASAKLVYTLDGTNPTAASHQASNGTTINIDKTSTLKVGLLAGGTVSGIITRQYNIKEANTINVYVNADNAGWSNVYYYTWGGSHSGDTWPGTKIETTTVIDGKTWYVNSYTMTGDDDLINFVFNTNAGTPQTVDVTNIKADAFFEISSEKEGNKYKVNDVTSQHSTGIEDIPAFTNRKAEGIYDIQGIRYNKIPDKNGIYMVNGRKVIVR